MEGSYGAAMPGCTVRFHRPVGVVFDYLSDPARRPEWQSSLRRVELIGDQRTGLGARWIDVTWAGLRPELVVVTHEPDEAWAEEGVWRGISAYLALMFSAEGEECDVTALAKVRGRGLARGPAALATLAAPWALRSDLRRADRILTRRQ